MAFYYRLRELYDWRGKTTRSIYLAAGVILFVIKYNLDRFLSASQFNVTWSWLNYSHPFDLNGKELGDDTGLFYLMLVVTALPFVWAGTVLTVRRLRDAGLPLWLVIFFYVPYLSFLFFGVLVILPKKLDQDSEEDIPDDSLLQKIIPDSNVGSGFMAVLVATAVGAITIILGVQALETYGVGLFIGTPFIMGLVTVIVYGYKEPKERRDCLRLTVATPLIGGIVLVGFAIEGLVCIAMTLPLAILMSMAGGVIGYEFLISRNWPTRVHLSLIPLLLLFQSGLMGIEVSGDVEPRLIAISSEVIIEAPPVVVWDAVVSFPEIAEPDDILFDAGVAYPIRAEIKGEGVGAVRYCVFSTGAFVEPIEVWDEPNLLQFSVSKQPLAMKELTPYKGIHPPHLDNFLTSEKGQFFLERLPDGRTRLEGTTWYRNRMWPGIYWQLWSDMIIHRIHMRVLEHIKQTAEKKEKVLQSSGEALAKKGDNTVPLR